MRINAGGLILAGAAVTSSRGGGVPEVLVRGSLSVANDYYVETLSIHSRSASGSAEPTLIHSCTADRRRNIASLIRPTAVQ